MNCCIDCFSSPYLKDLIIRNGSIGDCEICLTKSISIYDSKNLTLIFQNISDLYFVDNEFGENFECQIEKDFPNKIFSHKITDKDRKVLLQSILGSDLDLYYNLFNNKVYPNFANNLVREELVNPLQISWEKFAEEIKTTNRFHIQNTLDLDYLNLYFLIKYQELKI